MRLDKFLKVSRVIKRRTVANEAADSGRVSVNGKVVKPSYEVKVGDVVEIKYGEKIIVLKMELGEQADILYHLLTEQMTKAEIKAESEDKI